MICVSQSVVCQVAPLGVVQGPATKPPAQVPLSAATVPDDELLPDEEVDVLVLVPPSAP